jgi:hypothetical protein
VCLGYSMSVLLLLLLLLLFLSLLLFVTWFDAFFELFIIPDFVCVLMYFD